MAIQSHVPYTITFSDGTLTFDAPAGLSAAELKTYLINNVILAPTSEIVDDAWDAQIATQKSAKDSFKALPQWSTMTATDAATLVNAIANGLTKQQIIDKVNTDVTNLTTAKTSLAWIAGELVDARVVCLNLAKAVIFLRDLLLNNTNIQSIK